MKKSIFLTAAAAILIFASCEKESCTTCSLKEQPTGLETAKTFCGTDYEISQEDTRLKNEASILTAENPGYTYTGGCE